MTRQVAEVAGRIVFDDGSSVSFRIDTKNGVVQRWGAITRVGYDAPRDVLADAMEPGEVMRNALMELDLVEAEIVEEEPDPVEVMRRAIGAASDHQFPRLTVEDVPDEGETFKALRCPVCGLLVEEGALAAVTVDEHWQYNLDHTDFDHQLVTFNSDSDRDLGDTTFYLHNDDHAVDLPEGWKEEWL